MIAHYAAVKERLVAVLPAAAAVHDSALVNADGSLVRGQYVILFGGGPETLDDGRLTSPQLADSDAEFLYTVRSVSVTADGARAVASKVLSGLLGFVPVVPNRRCEPIRLDDSDSVRPDNGITPPLWYADMDFLLRSSRA